MVSPFFSYSDQNLRSEHIYSLHVQPISVLTAFTHFPGYDMAWTVIMHFLNSDLGREHLNLVHAPETPPKRTNLCMNKERPLFFFYEKRKGPKKIINFFTNGICENYFFLIFSQE